MSEYDSFTRYLNAKKSVDDRALNQAVWAQMAAAWPHGGRVLEVGAGTGTMIARLQAAGLLQKGVYTAVDADPANIAAARERWAGNLPGVVLELETEDLFSFISRRGGERWDVLFAHAFLDLMDIPATLPLLFKLLRPDGQFYFTINFDGETIFEPAIEPALDADIIHRYHRTMDRREVGGRPSGDSRSGRHLFTHIPAAGGQILAAGSSDWVVHSVAGGYPADEAYFLHFIIETVRRALALEPDLDQERFTRWIKARHEQIERGELVYIAHQLDFWGRIGPNNTDSLSGNTLQPRN